LSDLPLSEETPTPDEYRALRVAAGLSPKSDTAARQGLPGTLYAVCIRDGGRLIGMGRVIGDGGLNYDIVDMAVHPDHQRQGLGYRIMQALMKFVHEHAADSSYVSLLADDGAPALYSKFGFEFTAPRTVGMALNVRKRE
jgi:ribosomal protein S18 acetylase RimI-like enzyme